MPVRENKFLSLAFLITLILHLGLISPLSQWLTQVMVPPFSGESLEIDINEIQSNIVPVPKEKAPEEIQPPPEKVAPEEKAPEKVAPEEKAPDPRLETPPDIPDEIRPVPKQKKRLSVKAMEDSEKKVEEQLPPIQAVKQSEKPTPPVKYKKQSDEAEAAEEDDVESIRSPLFIDKSAEKETAEDDPPDAVKDSLRGEKPEETISDTLQYSMNTYEWRFDRFIDNWVIDIQKWWKAPVDYMTGKMPEGGDLWVQVHLARSGRLISYKILRSEVTPEMELRAIQALIGSLKRPELPPSFTESHLVINWRFIYPPLRPRIQMRR